MRRTIHHIGKRQNDKSCGAKSELCCLVGSLYDIKTQIVSCDGKLYSVTTNFHDIPNFIPLAHDYDTHLSFGIRLSVRIGKNALT